MRIDRRRLLQTTAAILATATASLPLLTKKKPFTLIDATLTERDLHAASILPGTNTKTIQPDLVRQWRDGLGTEITSAKGAIAYVRWDKALLLADLARESRMTCHTLQLDRSVFAISLVA